MATWCCVVYLVSSLARLTHEMAYVKFNSTLQILPMPLRRSSSSWFAYTMEHIGFWKIPPTAWSHPQVSWKMILDVVLVLDLCSPPHSTFKAPCTTKIFNAPRFRALVERWGGYQTNLWLGMYGAKTWKMVKVFCSDPFVYRLFRTNTTSFDWFSLSLVCTCGLFCFHAHMLTSCRKLDKSKFSKSTSTVCYLDKHGKRRFKGSRSLKSTQVYPRRFGVADS